MKAGTIVSVTAIKTPWYTPLLTKKHKKGQVEYTRRYLDRPADILGHGSKTGTVRPLGSAVYMPGEYYPHGHAWRRCLRDDVEMLFCYRNWQFEFSD